MAIESIKYKDYVLMVRQAGPHWGVVIKPTWYPQVLSKVEEAETREAAIKAAKAMVDQSPRRPS
ncbi:MAG TPA: hypothetical protein VFE41_33260 [Acetobacteraceae bacterium]|jgi:hypothetical protein|nr:hypothetical protein [Acetobacteraceae bacterium]